MRRAMFAILLMLLLVGCASYNRLGISAEKWRQLSPKKRQGLLNNYDKIKEQITKTRTPIVYTNGPVLHVYILNGKALMPPFVKHYSIETTKFQISPGVCKAIVLRSIDTGHSTFLNVCYNGARLSMDPSRYELDKAGGTIHFDYNPIWTRGFTYSDITSSGYVQLKAASISIKAVPSDLTEHDAHTSRH